MAPESDLRRPRSLALRVTVLVGLVTSLLFLLFTWSVESSIEVHFARMDLAELRSAWASVAPVLLEAGPAPDAARLAERLHAATAGNRDVTFLICDAHGAVLYRTAPPAVAAQLAALPPADAIGLAALRTIAVSHQGWRAAVVRVGGDRIALAMNIDIHLQYLRRLQDALWAGTLLASVITVIVAALAVMQGHAPLRRISARMRELSAERLHTRLDPKRVPIELQDLVEAFNAMLDRIEASFEQLRGVSADIAHELRTPITNLTTQTQVALSQPREAAAYREVLYSNLEEFERLSTMIGDMLFLAQTDRGRAQLRLEMIDLAAEAQALFDFFEALAEERGIALQLAGSAPPVQGDRAMLRRALSNLLSNALRYTPRGQAIAFRLGLDGEFVRVDVSNPGPDIAPAHLPHLFERFYRIEASRQRQGEGAGLGLAIVKSIVEMHGGKVTARSGGGRTVFSIRLPLRPAAG